MAEASAGAEAEAPEGRPLTLLSWNVAALKALAKETPPPLTWMRDKLVELGSPDLVCLQEHKLARDALTADVAVVEGYHAFFAHAKTSVGYSGVVTYVKSGMQVLAAAAGVGCCAYPPPVPARAGGSNGGGSGGSSGDCACPFECARFRALWEAAVRSPKEGLSQEDEPEDPRALLQQLDAEGRAVMTDHGAFVLVGVYCPFNNPEEPSREAFKHNWNVAVRLRCEALRASGRAVVLCGDLNAIPQAIDQPDVLTEADMRRSPWVRWMRTLLTPPPAVESQSPLFADTFRRMHPTREGAYTCWNNQTGARATNYGRRIDFILASPTLCDGPLATLVAAEVQQQVLGSDHCPVTATLVFPSASGSPSPFLAPGQPVDPLPPLCAATFPEFKGKQASLKGFLQPKITPAAATPLAVVVAVAAAPAASKVGAAATGGKGKKRASASVAGQQEQKKPKQQQLALSRYLVRSSTITSTTGSASASSSVRTVVEEEEAAAAAVEVVCIDDDDDEEEEEEGSGAQQVDEAAAQQQQAAAAAVRESFLAAFKPQTPPKCEGHDRPMVRRQVKKPGPTFGRYFWSCDLPEGRRGDPGVRCDTFIWDSRVKGVKGSGKGT